MTFKKYCLSLVLPAAFAAGVFSPQPAASASPRELESIVDRHASAHGLPVEFARAIVRLESSWNPQLTGAAGEVGLMQIKHETARYMGYSGSREQLYEPDVNVRWGMRYLADAWKLAQGDHCGTVLRYQAGLQARTMTDTGRAYCARLRKVLASID
jgi:soluble lytic murein transglycosylase-like protein